MKIVLISIKEPHMTFGHIGLEIISACLKKEGHEVHGMVDSIMDPDPDYITRDEFNNLAWLGELQPDFVGFNVNTMRYQWCLKFSRMIKKAHPTTRIIFGGPHPIVLPEMVLSEDCVDIVCTGEGEHAMVELLNEPHRTDIKNLWFNDNGTIIKNPFRPLVCDLDTLPFPDREMWLECVEKGEFKRYLCMVSRGCPRSCVFCQNSSTRKIYEGLGPYVRHRSPKNVIDELILAKKKFNINWIVFMDDNFSLKKEWILEFTDLYHKHINDPYACNTHLNTIDEERAHALKNSNCKFIMFGLQSGSEKIRKMLNRTETNKDVRRVTKLCHEVGLNFSIDHIFGLTKNEEPYLKESAYLYNEVRPKQINCFFLYLFPKTPIIEMKNLTSEEVNRVDNGTYQAPTFRTSKDIEHVRYRNLFTIIPIMPKCFVSWLLDKNKVHWCAKIPEFMIWGVKIYSNLRMGNTPSIIAHLKFLPERIRERMRGYKGEFD